MPPKVLYIILSQTRAHELTFNKFKQHVLDHLKCDLAVCASPESKDGDMFTKTAKYTWFYPEVDDWSVAYDEMFGHKNWRSILKIKNQVFGGILDENHQHPGSAGILIFFRWFLLQNLIKNNLIDKYDFFIVSRSDYLYHSNHPLITCNTSKKYIYIPQGEDYDGITDRYMLVSNENIVHALSIADNFLSDPDKFIKDTSFFQSWNLERLIYWHFHKKGLIVKRFPRIMFTVRGQNDETRWTGGEFNKDINLIVKYSSEYDLTIASQYRTFYEIDESYKYIL